MSVVEDFALIVEGRRFPSSLFKLKHSSVLIADFNDYPEFLKSINIKIEINFKQKNRVFWCNFECGKKSISLIGSDSIIFSGFTWSEDDGKVKAFKLNDRCCSSCCDRVASGNDLVLGVFIHEAVEKSSRSNVMCDCTDGGRSLIGFETEEKADEVYTRNTRYNEGTLVSSFYIIFYKKTSSSSRSNVYVNDKEEQEVVDVTYC